MSSEPSESTSLDSPTGERHSDAVACLFASNERTAGRAGSALTHVADADRSLDERGRREITRHGRKLFGLLPSTEKEKEPMICRDLYAMTLGTAERYDLEKEMTTAIEAANDEYVAFRPEAGSLRQAYERFYPGR